MCIYILNYTWSSVFVEDHGFIEGYDDAFREDEGDDVRGVFEGDDAFGENEGDDTMSGDVEDAARDQEQGHANSQ